MNTDPAVPFNIVHIFACTRCLKECPPGESPQTWSRLTVGFQPDASLQVWCDRHHVNIVVLPPQGAASNDDSETSPASGTPPRTTH